MEEIGKDCENIIYRRKHELEFAECINYIDKMYYQTSTASNGHNCISYRYYSEYDISLHIPDKIDIGYMEEIYHYRKEIQICSDCRDTLNLCKCDRDNLKGTDHDFGPYVCITNEEKMINYNTDQDKFYI